MNRLFIALVVLVCLLCSASATRAQGDGSSDIERRVRSADIQGTIRAIGGQSGLEHVRVELIAPAGESLGVVFTDSNGRFSFPAMPKRSYVLNITASGYEPLSETVDLSSGSMRGLDIALHKSGEAPAPPSGSGPTVSAHELSMPENARQAMQDGKEKLHGKKDAQGSLADFERAVTLAPGYYEAYYEMSVARGQTGDLMTAEQNLRKSIELSDDHFAQSDLLLGALLIDRSNFVDAERVLRRAVELSPTDWQSHYELGKSLLGQKRPEEALKSAEQARTLQPNAPLVYRLLITIHYRLKNQAAMLEDLDAYIKLDPDSPSGQRAKQMREEVQKSLSQSQAPPSTPTPPKP